MSPLLSSHDCQLLTKQIRAVTGLYFSSERDSDVQRMMKQLVYKLGETDGHALFRRLMALPMTAPEWQSFIDILTVGETYFMREPRALSLVESEVLYPLIRSRRQNSRKLKLWSAGCCTGEEAYSLAMLIDRMLPDRRAWEVEIIATDINPSFLERARKGVYGSWSFRQPGTGYQAQYFRRVGENYQIRPEIRDMIRFLPHNLSDQGFQASAAFLYEFDCVLCRNVMIYFHPEDVQKITSRFEAALSPGGWLVVGASEASHIHQQYFQAHYYPQAILYKKTAQPSIPPVVAVPQSLQEAEPVEAESDHTVSYAVSTSDRSAEPAAQVASHPPQDALSDCQEAITLDRLNPEHYRKMATLHESRQEGHEAAMAWRRVLYLNPADCMAHIQLGHLQQQAGLTAKARRHYRNALTLLREMGEHSPVPHSDGLHAGEMIEMIQQLLDGDLNA